MTLIGLDGSALNAVTAETLALDIGVSQRQNDSQSMRISYIVNSTPLYWYPAAPQMLAQYWGEFKFPTVNIGPARSRGEFGS